MKLIASRGFRFYDDEYFGNPEFNDQKCYISRSARITGKVIIEDDVIVCPHASLRADEGTPFKIMKGTNIQDSVVFHGLQGKYVYDEKNEPYSILIYPHCAISHDATVHGPAKIGKKCFVGFDAIVHASEVGEHVFIDFRATIKNSVIGSHCHIGIGAIVHGVTIGNNRYVEDGQVVNDQEVAKNLPKVSSALSEEDNLFNKDVVDTNKLLRKRYHQRRLEIDTRSVTDMEQLVMLVRQARELAIKLDIEF